MRDYLNTKLGVAFLIVYQYAVVQQSPADLSISFTSDIENELLGVCLSTFQGYFVRSILKSFLIVSLLSSPKLCLSLLLS